MTDRLLSAKETADRLGMSRAALDTLRSRGGGPRYIKVGQTIKYDPPDVARWIEAHKVTPARSAS